jgi:hypothetical protein
MPAGKGAAGTTPANAPSQKPLDDLFSFEIRRRVRRLGSFKGLSGKLVAVDDTRDASRGKDAGSVNMQAY